jgi:SpoVK/Ycf46/Vps4 family AAA+-type ATPase
MTKISWLQSNNTYKKVEGDFSTVESVPVGIYNIGLSMSGWYLEKYADKFTFDYKMYGLQTEFCEHVLKTYKNTKGNFGIMLTGTKGTGKTVTAKTLANDFNLPVIIVKDMGDTNQAMIEFLGGFNFDCVLFFDEFEKNFSEKDSTILQIMDGVYSSEYRKIFLLTTNEMTINENMVGRPSRIRYVRRFGNLELKTV